MAYEEHLILAPDYLACMHAISVSTFAKLKFAGVSIASLIVHIWLLKFVLPGLGC